MPHPPYYIHFTSPFGDIELASDGTALTGLRFFKASAESQSEPCPVLQLATEELDAFFKGELTQFSTPLRPKGTPFQQAVWQKLVQIPFGERVSYRDIATALGKPNASRAVGSANARNPIALMVPCHRVIKADGSLGGYAYGTSLKKQLLHWEQMVSARGMSPNHLRFA